MIGGSLSVLFAGLMLTGFLVFLSDFRSRDVHPLLWAPALLSSLYFYWTAALVVQVYVLPFVMASIVTAGLVLLAFRKKGFGGADSIAIVSAAAFPFLLVAAVVPAMVVSYLGMKMHLWGGAGVPVAGLIGLFMVAVLGLYVFV